MNEEDSILLFTDDLRLDKGIAEHFGWEQQVDCHAEGLRKGRELAELPSED